jgi:hypothetical protein
VAREPSGNAEQEIPTDLLSTPAFAHRLSRKDLVPVGEGRRQQEQRNLYARTPHRSHVCSARTVWHSTSLAQGPQAMQA